MIEISLTRGYSTVVDYEFAWITDYKWSAFPNKSGKIYAGRTKRLEKKQVTILMHRVIMKVQNIDGLWSDRAKAIDHQDGNGLNNLESNLRFANHAQNASNAIYPHGLTSQYRGVRFHDGSWKASIAKIHIGSFKTEIEAAIAYDEIAKEKYGEFATTNF